SPLVPSLQLVSSLSSLLLTPPLLTHSPNMGSFSSKPLPSRGYNRDSIVLCDGLTRLQNAKYAVTGDGRFVFVLGGLHISSVASEDDNPESAFSIQLDIIDLFLSKRTRISNIGDFYNLGHPTGFYALNERTVVVVDYDPVDSTLRQRLIIVDMVKETAECPFYRGYGIAMDSFFHAKTSTGEEFAVTVIPSLLGSAQSGVVYPMNPLSKSTHEDITLLIDQANSYVRQFYEAGEAKVATFYPPFFITSTVIGFFVDPSCVDDMIDPMRVVVVDITSGAMYMQEAKSSSSSFPISTQNTRPSYAKWNQATNREVSLVSRFRRTGRCWQVGVAWLILGLFQYTVYAAVFLWSWNWRRLGGFCLQASMKMLLIRQHLLEPRSEKFTGFGTLNTRTLEWNEIKATVWNEDETNLIPLRDGQFVVASVTDKVESNRVIGVEALAHSKMERFRLIGNPRRMTSLARLSSIALQKNDRVPAILLEQIAARMMV
ncbi:hypothetical protein PMAYCL1PPCAC_06413, partial [Pristionchus mayeri]